MSKFILPIYGIIKGKSITMNWYRNAHYRDLNRAKRLFKKQIWLQLRTINPIKGQIKIHYTYYACRRGTDLDNFVSVCKKFFQDCLVSSGKLAEDHTGIIIGSSEEFGGYDKNNPRVEAEIRIVSR